MSFTRQMISSRGSGCGWRWLGMNQNYCATMQHMKECVSARKQEGAIDTLLLVEHSPVYTFKPNKSIKHFKIDPNELRDRWQVDLVETDRGGDVTFHGPGQLVAYPILDLREHKKDLHWFVRQLEEVLIQLIEIGCLEMQQTINVVKGDD